MPPILPNTTFRDELRPFFEKMDCISHLRYIGDYAYASINTDMRLKAAFMTGVNSGIFDRIRLTIINKTKGEVDHVDIFMPMTSSPYNSPNSSPRRKYLSLSSNDNTLSWYKRLETAEIDQIRTEIKDFIGVYK